MSNLDRLYERARVYGVSADELLGEMLSQEESAVLKALDQGEADFAAGRTKTHEEVFSRLRRLHEERTKES